MPLYSEIRFVEPLPAGPDRAYTDTVRDVEARPFPGGIAIGALEVFAHQIRWARRAPTEMAEAPKDGHTDDRRATRAAR